MTRTQGFFLVLIALLWARDQHLIPMWFGILVSITLVIDNVVDAANERLRGKR